MGRIFRESKVSQREDIKKIGARLIASGVILYGDRVGVIRDPEEEQTKSGIIIPDEARRKPIRGRVVVVGQGCNPGDAEDPVAGMTIGDRVTFTKYNPIIMEVDLNDGDEPDPVLIEVMHSSDLYLAWRD